MLVNRAVRRWNLSRPVESAPFFTIAGPGVARRGTVSRVIFMERLDRQAGDSQKRSRRPKGDAKGHHGIYIYNYLLYIKKLEM